MPGRLVRMPLWWLLVGIATCVLTPVLSIWASVKIAQNNARELAAEYQIRSCSLYSAILDEYDENPPTTETGRGLREAYLLQYRQRHCTPERS